MPFIGPGLDVVAILLVSDTPILQSRSFTAHSLWFNCLLLALLYHQDPNFDALVILTDSFSLPFHTQSASIRLIVPDWAFPLFLDSGFKHYSYETFVRHVSQNHGVFEIQLRSTEGSTESPN